MHLKMKISMGGPDISVECGQDLPLDESFPFSTDEVHRFRAADMAELIGTKDEITAWEKANPYVGPIDEPATQAATAGDAGADVEKPATDDAKADTAQGGAKAAGGATAKKG